MTGSKQMTKETEGKEMVVNKLNVLAEVVPVINAAVAKAALKRKGVFLVPGIMAVPLLQWEPNTVWQSIILRMGIAKDPCRMYFSWRDW